MCQRHWLYQIRRLGLQKSRRYYQALSQPIPTAPLSMTSIPCERSSKCWIAFCPHPPIPCSWATVGYGGILQHKHHMARHLTVDGKKHIIWRIFHFEHHQEHHYFIHHLTLVHIHCGWSQLIEPLYAFHIFYKSRFQAGIYLQMLVEGCFGHQSVHMRGGGKVKQIIHNLPYYQPSDSVSKYLMIPSSPSAEHIVAAKWLVARDTPTYKKRRINSAECPIIALSMS